jgi:glycosyltransferase involved in cell wall biosynthesis
VLITQELFTSGEIWFFITAPLYYFMFAIIARKRSDGSRIEPEDAQYAGKEKTTVLMVLQNIDTGGLERMVLNLSAGLTLGEKVSVEVVTFNQNPDHLEESLLQAFREKGITVWLYRKRPGFSFSFLMRLIQHIRRRSSVILHAHELGALIYCGLAKLYFRGRVPIVYTQHSLIHLTHKSRYRLYEWLFCRFVDHIAVVSNDILQEYGHLLPSHIACSLIPNGVSFPPRGKIARDTAKLANQVESTEVARRLSRYSDSIWVLYLARFFPKKGQLEALSLWDHLSASDRRKTILIFVGPIADSTYYKEFLQQKEQCRDSERLIAVGSSPEPQFWMGVSDIFLSCSLYEGMPLAPLEALGSGLPSILSDIPGHRLFHTLGTMAPVHDMKQSAALLSHTIKRVMLEPEQLREESWKQGYLLRERFSIDQMITHYLAVYQQIQERYFREHVSFAPSAA